MMPWLVLEGAWTQSHWPHLHGSWPTQGAVQVFYLPLQSRQGLGRRREGTRARLSLHLLL